MFKSGFVAIIGEPNAGKSTLLNRWVGEPLAIVTAKAQTTRQQIRGIINRPNAQIIVVDTPGFHESTKSLNQYMIHQVKDAIRDVDVCCLVTDPVPELSTFNQELIAFAHAKHKPIIIAVNKIDIMHDAGPAASVVAEEYPKTPYEPPVKCEVFKISAANGLGCDALLEALIAKLPDSPALYPDDIYTELPTRFLVSEMIREVLLELLHQELPYSAAVIIEDYKEKPDITVIKATIVVEKDSQKAMVIGDGGAMIKRIGQTARQKIEKFIGRKVFLELLVRVEKNWTKDPLKLEELGYSK